MKIMKMNNNNLLVPFSIAEALKQIHFDKPTMFYYDTNIQTHSKYADYNKVFIFCNTGMERPETIAFLKDID